jgi:hypothetical protein
MKQLVPTSSLSLAGASLTMTGVNVPLSQILLIANATTGSVLYSMAGPAPANYSQGPSSTITLATTPGASDKLTVYYDDGVASSNAPSTVTLGGGSASIGAVTNANLDVPLSTRLKAADTLAGVTAVGSITNAVTLGGGSASIGSVNNTGAQFSKVAISTATLTRPANTTAYSANAVINTATSGATITSFTSVLPVTGADGYIVAVRALTNVNSFATAVRLHFFKATPTASVQDAAQFTLLNADFDNRVGYVDLSGWTSGGTGSDASVCFGSFPGSGSSLPLELASGSTTLYAILEARAAFTPTSGQVFKFSLKTQLA